MKQFLLTALLLFIFLLGTSCDCDPLKKLEKGDSTYQIIFQGRVLDTLTKDGQGVATFLPNKIFLGIDTDTFRIRYDNATDCLMSFAPGESWLIYVVFDGFKRATVHFCGHSRKFISANKSLDYYFQMRGTSFEEEAKTLEESFYRNTLPKKETEMPFRQLEHPDRGTAIWYILAALPILILLWWLLKKHLK